VIPNICPSAFNRPEIFTSATWLHVSGSTPALSETAAQITLDAVTVARELGLTVSCDYNFRGNLWRYRMQHGLLSDRGARFALEFATAASCLKHTIPGDVNLVSANEVEARMRGQGGGCMQC